MSTIQVEANLSPKTLLKAVEQLSTIELEDFIQQVLLLNAHRKAPSLSRTESELLLKINEGVPDMQHNRFNELREKQWNETITPEEHEELLELVDLVESIQVQRLKYLTELAQLRKTTVRQLMDQLGIHPPQYA